VLRARTEIAGQLRRDATEAEHRLWWALRERMPEHRFRRQHPIGRFVVDFACPAQKLAIELDGGQNALRNEEGTTRTSQLVRRGYRVIRFWNNEVMDNLDGVLETIRRELDAR
jgi:very-short-patch-repair endonuclease